MRILSTAAAAALLLFVAWPTAAQSPGTGNFFMGANPRNLTFKTVDVTRAMKPRGLTPGVTVKQPSLGLPNLTSFFPSFNLTNTWPPKRLGQPQVLTKNPFQPNPPKGYNPFDPPKKK